MDETSFLISKACVYKLRTKEMINKYLFFIDVMSLFIQINHETKLIILHSKLITLPSRFNMLPSQYNKLPSQCIIYPPKNNILPSQCIVYPSQ